MKNTIKNTILLFAILFTNMLYAASPGWTYTQGHFRGSEDWWQSPINPVGVTYHCPTAGTISVDTMKYILQGREIQTWKGVNGEFYDLLNYPQDFYLNWSDGDFKGVNNVYGIAWIIRVHFNNGIYGYAPQANDNKMFTFTATPNTGAAIFEYVLPPPLSGCAWADYLLLPYGASAVNARLLNYGTIIAIPPNLNSTVCPYNF